MKKKKILILLVLMFFIWILNIDVVNAKNPYKKSTKWGTNCTWYAWEQAHNRAGVDLPGWGNANTWIKYAKNAGYETGMTPKAKSIVVWEWNKYGHVGYVEKVVGDKIYVWDSDAGCIDENYEPFKTCMDEALMIDQEAQGKCYQYAKSIACEYSASYWSTPGDLIGYIYLDSAPKTTKKVTTSKASTTKKVTTKKETTTTTTTKAKSSNAYLSNITIKDLEINFDKETFEYTLNVDNNVLSITVDAIPEDETAMVQGFGEIELEVGENIVEIFVTAEDETSKTYTLKVYREDKETATTKKVEVNNNKNKFNNKTYFIIGGIIGVTILTIAIIKLRKK